jgi:hypothetical protein
MKRLSAVAVLVISFCLSACGPSKAELVKIVDQTQAAIPSQTPYPTYTPQTTFTPYPTYTVPPTYTPDIRIQIVTATFTNTPEFTPTITLTPTITPIPTNTLSPIEAPKMNGIYLVNVDMAPGLWRSEKGVSDDRCYWELTTKTGDIINNFYGASGGTMFIPESAFQVELKDGCGMWTYMGK